MSDRYPYGFDEPVELKQRRLDLERIEYCRQAVLSRMAVRDYPELRGQFERDQRYLFSAEFAGRRVKLNERRELVFPADWWQHLKQRWFPAWALRRWPMRYQVHALEVTAEATALFPEIAPFQARYVTICAFDQVRRTP